MDRLKIEGSGPDTDLLAFGWMGEKDWPDRNQFHFLIPENKTVRYIHSNQIIDLTR